MTKSASKINSKEKEIQKFNFGSKDEEVPESDEEIVENIFKELKKLKKDMKKMESENKKLKEKLQKSLTSKKKFQKLEKPKLKAIESSKSLIIPRSFPVRKCSKNLRFVNHRSLVNKLTTYQKNQCTCRNGNCKRCVCSTNGKKCSSYCNCSFNCRN